MLRPRIALRAMGFDLNATCNQLSLTHAAKFFPAAINSHILVHRKTWTASESTSHALMGPLSHRRLPKSIK